MEGKGRMRNTEIFCDKCGKQIKLWSGSEVQLSGNLVRFFRKQVGSVPTYKEFELCGSCNSEVMKFIIGNKYHTIVVGSGEVM